MMGSELHVESTVNVGSTFWFDAVLPAVECNQPQKNSCAPDSSETTVQETIEIPAQEDLLLLYQMAVIGDIMGIREHVHHLEQEQARLIPFVTKIRSLAKELNIIGIQQFLQHYLKGD